jgi:glycosyltransferase involved in cell wall biosynthesis
VNVALITEFFYPTVGGTQTAVAKIAEQLSRRGHQVTVFAPLYEQNQPQQPSQRYFTHWVRFPSWPLLGYFIGQLALSRLLKAFDVIHLFHPAFGFGAWLAVRRKQRPLIVALMGYDTYDFDQLPWLKRQIVRAVSGKAQMVTAPSQDLARLAHHVDPTLNIQIIPHGVELKQADSTEVKALRHSLNLPATATVFVAVQRLYPVKEPMIFIEAWHCLARPDCFLLVVGGGELEATLRKRISELGIDNIIMTGEVPAEKVPVYLRMADAFIHHSWYESFGLSITEAMCAGLPVIACQVGAVPEIVTHGEHGLLIPPSNPEAMAAAVRQLADNVPLRLELGTAAQERSRHFSWEAIVQEYERLYNS